MHPRGGILGRPDIAPGLLELAAITPSATDRLELNAKNGPCPKPRYSPLIVRIHRGSVSAPFRPLRRLRNSPRAFVSLEDSAMAKFAWEADRLVPDAPVSKAFIPSSTPCRSGRGRSIGGAAHADETINGVLVQLPMPTPLRGGPLRGGPLRSKKRKRPFERFLFTLVAGAGFEPATFRL